MKPNESKFFEKMMAILSFCIMAWGIIHFLQQQTGLGIALEVIGLFCIISAALLQNSRRINELKYSIKSNYKPKITIKTFNDFLAEYIPSDCRKEAKLKLKNLCYTNTWEETQKQLQEK